MGKLMGGIMYALLVMLLVQCSSLVWADEVDIIFYENTDGCSGDGYACSGAYSNTCCNIDSADGGSVLVTTSDAAAPCLGAQYYEHGYCNTLITSSTGNFCLYGGGMTGAFWYDECSRRRFLLGELESKTRTCKGLSKPTSVVFTEDGTKGNWILTSSDATKLYLQLKNVHESEKVSWLKSQGAIYKELDSDLQLVNKQRD